MLYRLHTIFLVLGVLTIGFMASMAYERAFSIITLGAVVAFITQGGLLLHFSREDERRYSERSLFLVVLIYSILLGTVFMWISYYYDGDTFMFSKTDAMLYYNTSMHVAESGFRSGIGTIMNNYAFDDWGALIFDSIAMSIIPNKLFLNAVYVILGAFSSVLLFRISKHYMPDSYAFLAAMSYGTSSYIILFHCTFLKESLLLVPEDKPFRGPENHFNGDYSYHCEIDGDHEWFQGRETITYKGSEIYECVFHGGLVE